MLLAIDIGSSSVKAALLGGTSIVGEAASVRYKTDYAGERAEVPVERIEAALCEAAGRVDVSQASAVGLICMAPAWLAMDEGGGALTPLITHQDRRSIEEARRIEAEIGRERHLALTGNRPTPGGISSTTAAWFAANTDVIERCAMLGHLPTYLMRQLCGDWTMDPSNAGFTGLMDVSALDWSDELCTAARVQRSKLPAIVELAVIDSGIAHSHAGGEYRTRRAECEQAARSLGVRWLRDVSLDDLPKVAKLPEPLNRRARHVVTENARVLAAVDALEHR